MKRRPTIIDVAKHAGVSKSTVSRVIRGEDTLVRKETFSKVLEAIEDLGYEHNALARSMRTNRTYVVSLIIPDIANPFWAEVARGVQDALDNHNYTVMMGNSDWDKHREENFLRLSKRNLVDGVIVNPVVATNEELLSLNIPLVVLGLGKDYPSFDMVGSDSYEGTKLALEHLYQLGHSRIGLICGLSRHNSYLSRLDSYIEFYEHHGMAVDQDLIVKVHYEQEHGYTAMQHLLSLPHPPTAVFAGNDILAIGALRAIIDSGLQVPEDISLVGMDDIYPVSITMPPLTTVAKKKYEAGKKAVDFLLQRMEQEIPPQPQKGILPCELISRGSTSSPK